MSRDAILGNALAIGCLLSAFRGAERAQAGSPSVSAISVQPAEVVLQGSRAAERVLVTGRYGSSSLESDLTALATYESLDPSVATVTPEGIVSPRGPGQATLVIRCAEHENRVRVRASINSVLQRRSISGPRSWRHWGAVVATRALAMGLHKARADSGSACAGSTPSWIS